MHDEKGELDFSSHGWLICHEVAHQLWGDLVTCRDWGHAWINESFCTYSEVMFALHDAGEDEAAVNLPGKKNQYLHEAYTRYMRPIVFHRWDKPGQNFDRHTYQKGAVIVHLMRWILGEKPFHKTLSFFLHKHAFQPVDTHDFLTAIKEATGQNMDWFFEKWLLTPGHPIFDVSYSWNIGTKKLTLKIVQTQDTSGRIPVFITPMLLGFVTPSSKRAERIWLGKKEEVFEFDCDQKPLMVRFDEGNYLLKEWTF
ncbi:M1 family metallopeptidase [Acidobacteriota bacterium]